jgi:(p)ppGpp synthase/HD superfamily hydrolase
MILTSRFERALRTAYQLHHRQVRKGSHTPYIAHLLSVAALVLEHGGDEKTAIAALLHDAAEDQGGTETLDRIRVEFGPQVAAIVADCSDSLTTPKPPWRERKEKYLAHLLTATPEVQLVSLADKVHNARSILNALRFSGDIVWDRFNGGREGTLWYYHRLVEIFDQLPETPLSIQFNEIVAEIDRLTKRSS